MRTINDIKIILYEKEDTSVPMVRNFLNIKGKEIIECNENRAFDGVLESLRKDGVGSKEVLVLKKYMGRIFQRCPGTPGMICCNYMLMNTGFNCLYDCAYCFLNSYLNSFGITQFINLDLSPHELMELASQKIAVRIGTGEFSDSLMFDEVTGVGGALIKTAACCDNLFLELKTKSDKIGHLLSIRDKGNAVLAWSLNTERNVALYESGTAGLEQRIDAAAAASGAGYLTAFHFDPIIFYEGWEADYMKVIDRLFSAVDPDRIAWISLGCFRHSPGFSEPVSFAFLRERLTAAEMFPGADGKYRYLKRDRIKAYSAILERIRSHSAQVFVYLCMESETVWRELFNVEYKGSDCLESAFCAHLARFFKRSIY